MVEWCGYSYAYDWATAHEEGATNNPPLEKEMDLWNNREGRLKASSAGLTEDSSVTATRAAIIEHYKSGELKRFNSSGTALIYFTRQDSEFVNTDN